MTVGDQITQHLQAIEDEIRRQQWLITVIMNTLRQLTTDYWIDTDRMVCHYCGGLIQLTDDNYDAQHTPDCLLINARRLLENHLPDYQVMREKKDKPCPNCGSEYRLIITTEMDYRVTICAGCGLQGGWPEKVRDKSE